MIEKVLKISGIVLWIALAIFLFDFIGLMAWIFSGQHPADGMFWGAISANIISAIIY